MERNNKSFLGKGWAFPPAFNLHRESVVMVEGEQDIKESISIILNTIPGERMLRPGFGCGLRSYVFESNDETYMSMLKDAVYDALLYHEPRIKDIEVEITHHNTTNGPNDMGFAVNGSLFKIAITYYVINTNTRNNMVIPFYKDEGTNL